MFVGAAIGGGVIVGGDYRRGVNANAGDVGLMPTLPSRLATAPRPSGPYDILLTRASLNALIRHLRGNGVAISNRSEVEEAFTRHPKLVGEWLDDCADALIVPLLSSARLLDVEAIVLDGDMPQGIKEDLLGRLIPLLDAATPEARKAPRLVMGMIGREASALGAAILPLHLNFSPNREILVNQ